MRGYESPPLPPSACMPGSPNLSARQPSPSIVVKSDRHVHKNRHWNPVLVLWLQGAGGEVLPASLGPYRAGDLTHLSSLYLQSDLCGRRHHSRLSLSVHFVPWVAKRRASTSSFPAPFAARYRIIRVWRV